MLRGGRASAAIALALVLAAALTLPLRFGPTRDEAWLVPPTAPPLASGADLPVFCITSAGAVLRCGLAWQTGEGRLLFRPYRSARFAEQTLPILTSADIGLLWALADPAGRSRIRDAAIDLTREMVSSAHDLIQSPVWQQEYRASLRDVLRRIAARAWETPDTQYAFHVLMRAGEAVVADSVARDIGPVIAPYVADALWHAVESNTLQAFSILRGAPLDFSAVGPALNQALRDPAVEHVLGQLGPKVMGLPQMELLSERMLVNLAEAAKADPQALELLTRIVTDPRLGPPLGHVRDDAGLFLRQLGGVLWGLGDGKSLNSLAGVAMRTAVTGTAQRIILIADPLRAQALRHDMPGGVAFLARETGA